MKSNIINLINCSTEKISVTDAKQFMGEIEFTRICKIVRNELPATGGKMVFNNGKEIEIIETPNLINDVLIVIEILYTRELYLYRRGRRVNFSLINGPFSFTISDINFEIREIPKPDYIKFEYENIKYTISIDAFRENKVQLPDGRVLLVTDWDKNLSYKPTEFTALKFPQAELVDKQHNTHTFTITKYIDVGIHENHIEHLPDGRKLIVEMHIEP